jgi:hypothetical protein
MAQHVTSCEIMGANTIASSQQAQTAGERGLIGFHHDLSKSFGLVKCFDKGINVDEPQISAGSGVIAQVLAWSTLRGRSCVATGCSLLGWGIEALDSRSAQVAVGLLIVGQKV